MDKILFIDDERAILENYRNIFKRSTSKGRLNDLAVELFGDSEDVKKVEEKRFDVLTATQGEEGVQIVKENINEDPVKVVFIDMRMPPGIDGVETACRIREADPRIEIVIVTAYSDTNLKEIVLRVGRPDKLLYLKKPFETQEIEQLALNLTTKYQDEVIKDQFIANISHELKTPLSAILGFYQLLQDKEEEGDFDEETLEYLSFIGSSAKVMKKLIDDLVSVREFNKGKISLEKEPVLMKDFLKDVYQMMNPLFKDSEVSFDLIFDQTVSEKTLCKIDRARVGQCISNLVDNSFKFTKVGKVEIKNFCEENNFVIDIRDTGEGIPNKEKEWIFEKFNRIENDHHMKPGLGLGLSVVDKIIRAHGAKLDIVSEYGQGSSFQLRFSLG